MKVVNVSNGDKVVGVDVNDRIFTGPIAVVDNDKGIVFIQHKDRIECFPIYHEMPSEHFKPLDFGEGEE